VALVLLYPQFCNRDCQHCLEWAYVDNNPASEFYGRIEEHQGKPQKRHPKHLPLCKTPEGCPKGTPEKPNTLSAKNMQAYIHYLECKAVGNFPDDPIVRRNARLIQQVVDHANEQKRVDELISLMGARR